MNRRGFLGSAITALVYARTSFARPFRRFEEGQATFLASNLPMTIILRDLLDLSLTTNRTEFMGYPPGTLLPVNITCDRTYSGDGTSLYAVKITCEVKCHWNIIKPVPGGEVVASLYRSVDFQKNIGHLPWKEVKFIKQTLRQAVDGKI